MSEDLVVDGQRVKERKGKPRWELLDLPTLEPLVRVLTYGAEKYADDSWKKVPPQEYYAAMMRHMVAHFCGERLDKETGLPHLAHALCDLYFLLWMDTHDD